MGSTQIAKHQVIVINNILDKQEIIEKLSTIQDEDMNGNNGDEYLWADSENSGCGTNLQYLVKVLENAETTNFYELAQLYMNTWLDHDTYYTGHDITVEQIKDNSVAMSILMTIYD